MEKLLIKTTQHKETELKAQEKPVVTLELVKTSSTTTTTQKIEKKNKGFQKKKEDRKKICLKLAKILQSILLLKSFVL